MSPYPPDGRHPASFRDPAGFVFRRDGIVYRQVNEQGRDDYQGLMESGLHDKLVAAGLLIPHEVVTVAPALEPAFKVLRPAPIPFLSYPHEWCFGQLQAAALTTLRIQQLALAHGMTLRDASASNVQQIAGRAVLIDTLSFGRHKPGSLWAAYGQFCRHFLAPLALMSMTDARLGRLSALHPDGLPLDLAALLLPWRTHLYPSLVAHLHLHARAQRKAGRTRTLRQPRRVGKHALPALVENLAATVAGLREPIRRKAWSWYEEACPHPAAYQDAKEAALSDCLRSLGPATVFDLGANTGRYSRAAARGSSLVVALDADPACVEINFQLCREAAAPAVLPLVLDLLNPSPPTGWRNRETLTLAARGPASLLLCLGLAHHLRIRGNLPYELLAEGLADLGESLLIEHVPPDDPQALDMLALRDTAFDDLSRDGFLAAFSTRFRLSRSWDLAATGRSLHLLHRARGQGRT